MSARHRERKQRNRARHLLNAGKLDRIFTDPATSAELGAQVRRLYDKHPGILAHADQMRAARQEIAEAIAVGHGWYGI